MSKSNWILSQEVGSIFAHYELITGKKIIDIYSNHVLPYIAWINAIFEEIDFQIEIVS